MAGEQLGSGGAQLLDLVAVCGLDERVARGEVAVERADPDAGAARDRVQRCIRAAVRERGDRRREQLLAVAARIRPHNRRSPPNHASLLHQTEDTSDCERSKSMATTTYGFETTAAEVASGIDLSGKRVIVTGGSSGIGFPTARALAGTGAEVTLAVRDTDAGDRAAAGIDGDVRVARLDLADPASVKAFTDAWEGPLHVLVN